MLGSGRTRYLTDFDLAMSWNGGFKSRVMWWWHDLELSRRFWCAVDAFPSAERTRPLPRMLVTSVLEAVFRASGSPFRALLYGGSNVATLSESK
jgi:hypothetical protein